MKLFYLTSIIYLVVFLGTWEHLRVKDQGIKRGMMSTPEELSEKELKTEMSLNKELPEEIDTSKSLAPVQRFKSRKYFSESL